MYVCGGYNGHRSLTAAECYDPNTNQWTVIANMRSNRSGLRIAAYKGRIYAVSVFNECLIIRGLVVRWRKNRRL